MKKLIALLLALTMVAAMAAGCNNNATNDTTTDTTPDTTAAVEDTTAPVEDTTAPVEDTTAPVAAASNDAVAVLSNIWNLFGEDEKFFTFGGDGNNMVDGAPGVYADMEALPVQLVVPTELHADIAEIGSLFHGMMVNNFTSGVFKLVEGADAAAFADALHEAVANNQWMCGFPEKMMIAVVDGEYVVLAFGLNDVIGNFEAKLMEAYPEAEVKYTEAING